MQGKCEIKSSLLRIGCFSAISAISARFGAFRGAATVGYLLAAILLLPGCRNQGVEPEVEEPGAVSQVVPPQHASTGVGAEAGGALSATQPLHSNPEVEAVWQACMICHSTREMQRGPILDGREAWYLQMQLAKYRDGLRGDLPKNRSEALMKTGMDKLPDASWDASVAAYIASLPVPEHRNIVRADPEVGRVIYQAKCAPCHGGNAEGRRIIFAPRLTGVEDWYLLDAMRKYQKGTRGWHPDDAHGKQMQAALEGLEDADLKALAAFISRIGG